MRAERQVSSRMTRQGSAPRQHQRLQVCSVEPVYFPGVESSKPLPGVGNKKSGNFSNSPLLATSPCPCSLPQSCQVPPFLNLTGTPPIPHEHLASRFFAVYSRSLPFNYLLPSFQICQYLCSHLVLFFTKDLSFLRSLLSLYWCFGREWGKRTS